VARNNDNFSDRVSEHARETFKKIVANTPVDTGHLRNSWEQTPGAFINHAPYASEVEERTRFVEEVLRKENV